MVFFNVVLPIFIVMGTGFIVQKWRPLDSRVLSTLLMYLFGPALSFSAIIHSSLTMDDVRTMTIFALIFIAVTWLVGGIGGRMFNFSRETTAALLVSILLSNSANYGGTAALFAWGTDGFQTAIVFMAIHQLFASILAIYVSARGQQGVKESFVSVLKQPIFYASVLGFALRMAGWDDSVIPPMILRPIDTLADANIPLALVLLGMQLSKIRFETEEIKALGFVNLSRLILIPVMMVPILGWLGAEGLLRNVLILQAAMPTAVTSLVFASEFDARPDLVGAAVVTTTFVSLATVTVLLQFLGTAVS